MTAQPLLRDTTDRDAFRRAALLLQQAILVAPRPRLWLHLQYAEALTAIDDRPARRVVAEALLELWPHSVKALVSAGTCLLSVDPARACRVLQAAVDTGNAEPRTGLNLGIAQILDRRVADGVTTLAAAFNAPGLKSAQRQRCLEILAQVRAFDVEARCAASWLELEPENVTARRFVARAATREGDHARALELFAQCVAAAPDDLEVRSDAAFAQLRAGDPAAAVAGLRAVLTQLQDRPHTHALLLDALDALGDEAGRRAELERWVAAKPDDAAAWQDLAEARLAGGDAAAVEAALAAAEQADYLAGGRDAAALELRAVALERLGRIEQAASVRARIAALPATR